MNKPIVNIAASVLQRLLNLARDPKEDFGLVLTKYGLEGVLYRIAQSGHRKAFILKGTLLFELWTEQRHRRTCDADLLARGDNSPERFIAIFKEICNMEVEDDGLRFDPVTVRAEQITEDADYEGIRVKFFGFLENARIPMRIDLGFGDVITPAPIEAGIPSLLDLPNPRLLTYSRESLVAEKFEAMVSLGLANSPMKDFYDFHNLSREFSFDGNTLSEAVRKTFERRGTPLPKDVPLVFTAEFFDDDNKKKQWEAFCNKNGGYVTHVSLEPVCKDIALFLMPIVESVDGRAKVPNRWSQVAWTN